MKKFKTGIAVTGLALGVSLIAGTAAWSAAASGDANATAKTPAPATGMSCPMMGGGMMNDQNDAQGGGMMGMMQMMQGCRKMMGDQDGTQKGGMKGMSCPMMGDKSAATGKVAQATQEKNLQRATITIADGYQPTTLKVQAGKPLELTFLSKSDSCANTVNIPSLKQSFTLKNGARKTITFTPQKGTTAFSCAMGMFKGKVVAR